MRWRDVPSSARFGRARWAAPSLAPSLENCRSRHRGSGWYAPLRVSLLHSPWSLQDAATPASSGRPAVAPGTAAPQTPGPTATAQPSAGLPARRPSVHNKLGGPPDLLGWHTALRRDDVADPGAVRGLFVAGANQTNNASVTAAILKYLPSDQTICGANLVIPWSAIDRGPSASPRYDWSFLDQAAAPWEAAGKIVNLIVWGTDEKAAEEVDGQRRHTGLRPRLDRHGQLPQRRCDPAVLGARLRRGRGGRSRQPWSLMWPATPTSATSGSGSAPAERTSPSTASNKVRVTRRGSLKG